MTPRQSELDKLARADHDKGCRNEPPFAAMTVSHAMVHEANATRQYNRAHPRSSSQPTPTEGGPQ